MIPTSVFPIAQKLYPNHLILGVKKAWKPGFGWATNIYHNLPVLSQVRILKKLGFTNVSLMLRDENTSIEFTSDFRMSELVYYKLLQTFVYTPLGAFIIG